MHILPLCLFKKFATHLWDSCHGRESKLETALFKMTIKRPQDLGAHWPSHIKDRLGYWKVEQYQHFIHFVFFISWIGWDLLKMTPSM
jgi:hypothetical protein